jgi:hypothetical protein
MVTSADIKHAAIQFFSKNLDCSSLDPDKALEFLANEQSMDAGSYDEKAYGLDSALKSIKERLGPSKIEIFDAEKFRDQVVQVWLARAFCCFAKQIASKLEAGQNLAEPYCEIFDYAKGLVEDCNQELLGYCADVNVIAKDRRFQEQGWACHRKELRRMHEKLYSYSWEEYKKAVDLYNETGSMHTSEGSAWDGSNLSDTFMSMDGTTSMDGTDLDNTISTADTTMKSNI